MEENKCCPNGDCEKCVHNKDGHCGHRSCWNDSCGKFSRIIVPIILLAIAFFLGTLVETRSDFRGRMMDKNFINKDYNTKNSVSGSTTVNVLPPEADVDTNTPPVLE